MENVHTIRLNIEDMQRIYSIILNRIFGPNAADVLQFTNNLSLGGGNPTRIHVMANDDFRLFAHPGDDDLFDDHFPVSQSYVLFSESASHSVR